MRSSKRSWGHAAVVLGGLVSASAVQADCKDFSWDVHQERALFLSQPHTVQAGRAPIAAPQVQTDHFYALQLAPQPQVQFEVPPGKTMLADGAYAGVVKFTVPQAGSYRVALDVPFWLDVVADGKLLPTQDFQGSRCDGPHKMVEFMMPAHQQLWLQFSGASSPQVHVSITRAPAAASAH
jgi:hypothetical protein